MAQGENDPIRKKPSTDGSGSNRYDETVATVALIHGRVQGVGYRYWAATTAEHLRLRGYVRNLTDGSVEALLIGTPSDIARMLSFCEEGPDAARVDRIDTRRPESDVTGSFDRFRRLRTADPGSPV